jgi:hypothetical protein
LRAALTKKSQTNAPDHPEIREPRAKLEDSERGLANLRNGSTGYVFLGTRREARYANLIANRTPERIDIAGLPDDARASLIAKLPVHTGDALSSAAMESTEAAIRAFDEHMEYRFPAPEDGQAVRQIFVPRSGGGRQ